MIYMKLSCIIKKCEKFHIAYLEIKSNKVIKLPTDGCEIKQDKKSVKLAV